MQIAAHNSLKDASSSSFIMRRTRFYRILKSEIFLQKRREIRAGCMTWSLPLAPVINKIVGNSLHEIYQFVTMLVKLAFTPHSLVFFSEKGADIFRLYFWKGIMLCFHRFFQIWYRNFSLSQKIYSGKQYIGSVTNSPRSTTISLRHICQHWLHYRGYMCVLH